MTFDECYGTPAVVPDTVYDLGRRYVIETERFDRTVCTGPIRDGAILPFDAREIGLINRNAARVRSRLQSEAMAAGILWLEVKRAAAAYEGSRQYFEDMAAL